MTYPDDMHPRRPSEPGPAETRAGFRALLARRVAVTAALVALVALMAVMVYTVLVLRQTQVDHAPTLENTERAAKASAAAAAQIKSCTTPDGACYRRNQRNGRALGASVSQANALASAAAAACAVSRPSATFEVIYRCTLRRVDAARPAKP
jgi:hypothetical protein